MSLKMPTHSRLTTPCLFSCAPAFLFGRMSQGSLVGVEGDAGGAVRDGGLRLPHSHVARRAARVQHRHAAGHSPRAAIPHLTQWRAEKKRM